MSRTQVALRFQRAFPRFATSVGGGVGALGFEVPSTVSSDRFLTRVAFVRCRPDVAPCVRVHPELQPVCLSSRGRVVGPEPPVVITRSIRRAARSKAHLAAARPGATERLLQGFPKNAPPSTWPTGVHSRRQDRVASGLLPSAGRCHRPACSVLVVSHHLDGFLHRRPVGLLHPTADPGVHRVSAPCTPCKRAAGASPPMPHPPEPSPPVQPYPRHREPLPSCRFQVAFPVPPGPARLQGLAPYEQCVAMVRRCRQAKARCSPGLPVLEHHDCRPIMATGGRSRRTLRARTLSGDRA